MTDRPTSDPSTGAVGELAHMHYTATNSVGTAPPGGFRPSRPGERRGGRAKGTPNRTTLDFVMASFKHDAREAVVGQGNTSQSHDAQSAPPIERRTEFKPPRDVI